MLKWITGQCGAARWVVRVDDDVAVHSPAVIAALRDADASGAPARNAWWGIHRQNIMVRYKRAPSHFVPSSEYRDEAYPEYTSGMAFVARSATLARVLAAADSTPFFWIDDVYNGVLLAKAGVQIRGIDPALTCFERCMRCARGDAASPPSCQSRHFSHLPGSLYSSNILRLWFRQVSSTAALPAAGPSPPGLRTS